MKKRKRDFWEWCGTTDAIAAFLPPFYLIAGLIFGGVFLATESASHAYLSIFFLAFAAFAAYAYKNDFNGDHK